MNYKLDYITRVLTKTSKKRIENYVISRIWHLLNSDEIKIMHQQYVDLENGKYALTDLYFPQINYHVEVYEEFHVKNEEKINSDKIRAEKIFERTKGHKIKIIDCQTDLKTIHSQIDETIFEINSLIKNAKNLSTFKPWEENEFDPKYWIQKGILNRNENINLKTIDDIGELFDVKIKNRGYQKVGSVQYTKNGFSEIWWPSKIKRSNWENEFDNDFEIIKERNSNADRRVKHVEDYLKLNPNCKRVVFFKYKDELGFNFYKFVGCYKLNSLKSKIENQLVWERFSEILNLN